MKPTDCDCSAELLLLLLLLQVKPRYSDNQSMTVHCTIHQAAPLMTGHTHLKQLKSVELLVDKHTHRQRDRDGNKHRRTHTIQKSVSLANPVYCSMVERTLNIKHISTIMNLRHTTQRPQQLVRPPDIVCRRNYILIAFLLSFFFSSANLRGR